MRQGELLGLIWEDVDLGAGLIRLHKQLAGHAKPSITLDLYVGEFEDRKPNDSSKRLAALYGVV